MLFCPDFCWKSRALRKHLELLCSVSYVASSRCSAVFSIVHATHTAKAKCWSTFQIRSVKRLLMSKQFNSSYPERIFRGNQLLDASISLSPLYPSATNDFPVGIVVSFHQSFPIHSAFTLEPKCRQSEMGFKIETCTTGCNMRFRLININSQT